MDFPHTSASLAAFFVILQQGLMISVGSHRLKAEVGVGFGEDQDLERKIRRHGNLAENAALLVVVLMLTELSGAPNGVVTGFAILFAVARVSHAIAFTHLDGSHNTDGNKLFAMARGLGAMGSALGGIALGAYLAYSLLA